MIWQPIETANFPSIGGKGFGTRVLITVDCGEGTLKSTRIGWWCDKWMLECGYSARESGYRVTHWQPLPEPPCDPS